VLLCHYHGPRPPSWTGVRRSYVTIGNDRPLCDARLFLRRHGQTLLSSVDAWRSCVTIWVKVLSLFYRHSSSLCRHCQRSPSTIAWPFLHRHPGQRLPFINRCSPVLASPWTNSLPSCIDARASFVSSSRARRYPSTDTAVLCIVVTGGGPPHLRRSSSLHHYHRLGAPALSSDARPLLRLRGQRAPLLIYLNNLVPLLRPCH
jgi:hypothetical protein